MEISKINYNRKTMLNETAKAGFSLKDQIKVLEKLYLSERNDVL